MTTKFFATPRIQQLMQSYTQEIESMENPNDFEKNRNNLITCIFNVFLSSPEEWDEKGSFNILHIGEAFTNELEDKLFSNESLNLIFAICFRICVEPTILTTTMNNPLSIIGQIKDFGIHRHDEFDDTSKGQINYALREMPLNIFRDAFKSDEIQTFKDFMSNVKSSKEFASDWEGYIEDKKKQVEDIKSTLEGYESAFNFVGLFDGFKTLGDRKNKELFLSRILLFILALLIPCPLALEFIISLKISTPVTFTDKITNLIPLISLTFILIYYFRVALTNHTSLKAQALQIDLRKSLCQFIQSYADYSKKIKEANQNSLAKFEDVIFSNIIPNQDKIPSTFDGIEQIASLISAIKPK